LRVEEAAEVMGMSPRHVRRLVAERRIAFHRLGRSVRLTRADIDAYVAGGPGRADHGIRCLAEPAEGGLSDARPASFRQCSATVLGSLAGPVPRTRWSDAVGARDLRPQGRGATLPDLDRGTDRPERLDRSDPEQDHGGRLRRPMDRGAAGLRPRTVERWRRGPNQRIRAMDARSRLLRIRSRLYGSGRPLLIDPARCGGPALIRHDP
jgi:excisionase family DNA binding protein